MDKSVYLLRNDNRLTRKRVSECLSVLITFKLIYSFALSNDILFLRISTSRIFLQIFKTAENLDLGCGAGGGKDNKDIFKVGICIAKGNTEIQLNPDNSNLQGKSKKVRVIEGKITVESQLLEPSRENRKRFELSRGSSKKITWRRIEKGSS